MIFVHEMRITQVVNKDKYRNRHTPLPALLAKLKETLWEVTSPNKDYRSYSMGYYDREEGLRKRLQSHHNKLIETNSYLLEDKRVNFNTWINK